MRRGPSVRVRSNGRMSVSDGGCVGGPCGAGAERPWVARSVSIGSGLYSLTIFPVVRRCQPRNDFG